MTNKNKTNKEFTLQSVLEAAAKGGITVSVTVSWDGKWGARFGDSAGFYDEILIGCSSENLAKFLVEKILETYPDSPFSQNHEWLEERVVNRVDKNSSFEEVAMPLVRWLRESPIDNPRVFVTTSSAELLDGVQCLLSSFLEKKKN